MAEISVTSQINRRVGHWTLAFSLLLALTSAAQAVSSYPSQSQWINHANNFLETSGWLQRDGGNLDAFMWFNKDKMIQEGYDWRVHSAASYTAYKNWTNLQPGAYLDGFPQRPYPNPPSSYVPDTTPIANWEADVGHQTRIGWFESLMTPFPAADVLAIHSRDSTPYIVLEPFDVTLGDSAYNGASRLQSIVDGDYDVIPGSTTQGLQRWAEAAAALYVLDPTKRIEIAFGHEMNGSWFTWGLDYEVGGVKVNTPDLYKSAFQHVVDVFDAAGADNVDFVWSINASWHDDFSVAFPGTQYVDRMGMNGYNRGKYPPGTHSTSDPEYYLDWREFEEIFGQWDPMNPGGVHNYNRLVELGGEGMPIMITEFASVPEPATLVILATGGLALLRRRRP